MNAAIRAATRMALEKGAEIYAVCEGYDGLVGVRSRVFSRYRFSSRAIYISEGR